MRKLFFLLSLSSLLLIVGCSTTATFKLPPNTRLQVTDRDVTLDANNQWTSSPYFWSQVKGAEFRLYNEKNEIVRKGRLATRFRVISIFWPPFALIYWPMGLVTSKPYDLTTPQDTSGIIFDDPITPVSKK